MKKIIGIVSLLWITCISSQEPAIEWQKCLGGTDRERGKSIKQTTDGGYITIGDTDSNDGDVSGNHSTFEDAWVVKQSSSGEIEWQKCLGGTYLEYGSEITQTTDEGYIVSISSYSNDGDVTGNHGSSDFWIVKLSSLGEIEWQKSLGGSADDEARSIIQTVDEGYIIVGHTSSNDGDVSGNHGAYDGWVVKLSSTGEIEWQKCLGGSSTEVLSSIKQTNDDGYIVAGGTYSNDGDVYGNHGDIDFWVVKLTSLGDIEWQKCLGGTEYEIAFSMDLANDGGYIVSGGSLSNDGDVSGNHGFVDAWVVKLSSAGAIEWQKALGGSDQEYAYSIVHSTDNGYILAGLTASNDGDVSGNHGGQSDIWIVKLSSTGEFEWQKCLGGTSHETAYSIKQIDEGVYILAGNTFSNNGDVSGNHGDADFWVVKLSGILNAEEFSLEKDVSLFPNPVKNYLNIETKGQIESLRIYSLQGHLIKEVSTSRVDVSNLNTGLYFVQVLLDGKTITKKFIKK